MPITATELAAVRAAVAASQARPVCWSRQAERHRNLASAYVERLAGYGRWLAAAAARDSKLRPFYRLSRAEALAALAAARRHQALAETCAARAAAEDHATATAAVAMARAA